MKEIIALINQKGGVGKTTTVHALGAGLKRMGFVVLFIDLDPQSNLSFVTGASSGHRGSYEVLTRRTQTQAAIQRTVSGDIITASPALATEEILIGAGREHCLKEALEPLKRMYDYVVIDCPPSLGILTINALTAATGVIIPAQADIFSLQALGQFSGTLEAVKRHTNPDLILKGILITRFSGRVILSRDIQDMMQGAAKLLNTKVYKTEIRECVAIKEAQAKKQDIFTYAPKSHAATDYNLFIREATGNVKEKL